MPIIQPRDPTKRLLYLILKNKSKNTTKTINSGGGGGAALGLAGSGNDELVKVSDDDTTAGFLSTKLVEGKNVTLTVLNDAANETYEVAAIEEVTGLPAWGASDEGRVVYDNVTELLYFGSSTAWVAASGGSNEFADNLFRVYDNGDNTKELAFECSGISAGTTRTLTVANQNAIIGLWDLSTNTISPVNSSHILEISRSVNGGAPIVGINSHAGGYGIRGYNSSSGDGIRGVSVNGVGVKGLTGTGGNAIEGSVTSGANSDYGVAALDKMYAGESVDFSEFLGSPDVPDPPDAGKIRLFAQDGGFYQNDNTDSPRALINSIRKNSISPILGDYSRHRLNLIEGTGVEITINDDHASDEIDITISTSGVITGSGTDDHVMRWNGTGAAQDSAWSITDAGVLSSDLTATAYIGLDDAGKIVVKNTADNDVFASLINGDSSQRFAILAGGKIQIGSGSASADVELSRLAANLWGLSAGDALVIGSTAGDHASTTNGTISYNSSSNKFRVYQNGAWTDMVGGGGFTSFTVAGDTGSSQTITDGNTLTLTGGTGVDTVASATDTVTFSVDVTEIEATSTDMVTETSSTLVVTPAVARFAPGVAKFWALINGAATSILNDYNVDSIGDGGAGNVDLTIGTDFSSANWSPQVSVERVNNTATAANNRIAGIEASTIAAGTVSGTCWDTQSTPALKDPNKWAFCGHGYQ